METEIENKKDDVLMRSKGFKKTKMGWIPEDWEVIKLENLFDFKNGVNAEKSSYESGIPFINVMDVLKNNFLKSNDIKGVVNLDEKAIQSNLVVYGDVLFNRTSETNEDIGLTSVYLDTYPVVFGGFVIRGRTKNKYLNKYYLKDCFNNNLVRKQIISKGQGAIRVNIGQKDLGKVVLPLPPLPEQKQIAEILSTWDEAIESSKNLIEKLKLRKKGLMQQLLTGKKRLNGFDGEWENMKLKDIANRVTHKNTELNDNVVTISAQRGFVRQEDYFNKRVASSTLSGYYLLKRGEFAYNKSYSKGYPMGAFKRLDDFDLAVVTTLYTCFKIRKEKVNSDFLVNYFEEGFVIKGLMRIAQEGGRAHGLLNIGLKDFFDLDFTLPNIKEQNAIAEVLNNADQEIKASEEKLFQLETQKKGLMQQLLTGQLRVSAAKND